MNFNLDYLKYSISNLIHRKLRSWLTMLGIFIGIAAVVSLIGLGEGLRAAINAQFGFLGTDIISVTATGGFGPPGAGVVDPLTDKELNEIEKVKGVDNAAGRILESIKLSYNRKARFGYAASVPEGEDREVIEHVQNMVAERGRLLQDGDKGVLVLGYSYFENKDIFGKTIDIGSKVEIQDEEFRVIGILEKKGSFQVDRSVLINEDDLRELVNRPGDDYDIIAVRFDENADVEKIQADIEKRLRKARDVKEEEEDFSVQTPASILESVNSTLLAIQIFVYIIAGISLLVGGIGIMNTMYTAVIERTKEIGIMKSIGAKNSTVFTLFFIESGLLGAVGGIVGAIFGYLIATGLALAGRAILGTELIAAHISPQLIIGALLFSFVIGSFFGTLPAVRASKLNPVDALRYAK
jgi:putative ABC transport system permease protein